jgi:phage gpG-like protein
MVSIGTNVIYAPTHQFGARQGQYGRYATRRRTSIPIPWGDVPARPFLGVSAEDERVILNLIKANLF